MSGFFKGVENKELYIIGAVLFLLLLSNNFSFTGLASSRSDYERNVYQQRNPYCLRCFSDNLVRQDASKIANNRNVGRLSASESLGQNPSQHRTGVGGTCYLNNGGEGRLMLGEGNSLYCLPLR